MTYVPKTFLGQDTKVPIRSKFTPVRDMDCLLQDIQILLLTMLGERPMFPEYGCRLYTRIWDNIEDVAQDGLSDIRDAINEFEPRVELVQVKSEVNRNEGLVRFIITFKIIGTNTVRNLVFPFKPRIPV